MEKIIDDFKPAIGILLKYKAFILAVTFLFSLCVYLNLRHYDLNYTRADIYRISTEIKFTPERAYDEKNKKVIHDKTEPTFQKIIEAHIKNDFDIELSDLSRRQKKELDGYIKFYALYSQAHEDEIEKAIHSQKDVIKKFFQVFPRQRFSISDTTSSLYLPGKELQEQRSLLILIPIIFIGIMFSFISAFFFESLGQITLTLKRTRK